jgi:adenine-specific DNA-methyltransferase
MLSNPVEVSKEDSLSEYSTLRARIGQNGADRAVQLGWIDAPESLINSAETLILPPVLTPRHLPIKRQDRKEAKLGQFMTSSDIARFMAGMFSDDYSRDVRLLDAGAGRGALTDAFAEKWKAKTNAGRFQAHCYEIDPEIIGDLKKIEKKLRSDRLKVNVTEGDFIELATKMLIFDKGTRFTHAIMNPPYKKINSQSDHRDYLRRAGIETVNLYSGFVALAIKLLEQSGTLVAIIPRSFCNGPYYESFRRLIFDKCAILHVHLFEARNQAFKDDGVLQENIIIKLRRGEKQGKVVISTSADSSFCDYVETHYDFESIVSPEDPCGFIHIPTGDKSTIADIPGLDYRLEDLGLTVSTGPVVDFRMKADLRADFEPDSVPLLYPGHFSDNRFEWPKSNFRKPNAIHLDSGTAKWLFPNGYYTVVRRFSSKEEKRRVVAGVVDPAILPTKLIGFENHLNVIHRRRGPLDSKLAHGLAVFLNSTAVDQYFRQFNGHTQVNATDLRSIKFPSEAVLISLGGWAESQVEISQSAIDERLENIS